ncbi:hypothetical protein [Rhodanobacter lindaniclasticus]
MIRQSRHRTPALCAAAALLFAAAHLAFEHVNGGVRSHHLLDRADLPAISNWLGLVVLPVLGALFGQRICHALASPARPGLLAGIWLGLGCAMAYGVALAVSFALGASTLTSGLFLGLFLLAAADLPRRVHPRLRRRHDLHLRRGAFRPRGDRVRGDLRGVALRLPRGGCGDAASRSPAPIVMTVRCLRVMLHVTRGTARFDGNGQECSAWQPRT